MSSGYLSKDTPRERNYPFSMTINNEEAAFNEALVARTHRLRNDKNCTSEQMAIALGVPVERYRKYEYRSPLPHYLIERFALICDRDIQYILTGKSAAKKVEPQKYAKKRA